jgi:hypothetical protein
LRRDSESQHGCPDEGAGSGVLLADISGDFFPCPSVHDSTFVVDDVIYETFEIIRSTNEFFFVDMSGRSSSFSVSLFAGPLAVSIASSTVWFPFVVVAGFIFVASDGVCQFRYGLVTFAHDAM